MRREGDEKVVKVKMELAEYGWIRTSTTRLTPVSGFVPQFHTAVARCTIRTSKSQFTVKDLR